LFKVKNHKPFHGTNTTNAVSGDMH
jgi:hypothetical protein